MPLFRESRFIYCHAECRNAEWHCAECHYAECLYTECRYADSHGAYHRELSKLLT
jgi:hypothetical protein